MQASIDCEFKSKCDLLRQKKKLESDVNELELSIEYSNKSLNDSNKSQKKLQSTINEQQLIIENIEHQKIELNDTILFNERRATLAQSECDEIRLLLEQAERYRKSTESDLNDAADKINELNSTNNNLISQKRKAESDLALVTSDLDDSIIELKLVQESLNKSLNDSVRQAEQLTNEQQHSSNAEKSRKILETQLKDLHTRLDQAETNALKGGKRFMQKLESRIVELEQELECEQRHHQETMKEVKKNDRRIKDLTIQSDEDRKNQNKLVELNDKLQHKLKVFKRQIEETEQVTASNVARAISRAPQ